MSKRYVVIWLYRLKTDWFSKKHPVLSGKPLAVYYLHQGRMIISAVNELAKRQDILPGMVVADARALLSSLEVVEDKPVFFERILEDFAKWLIRYSPDVAVYTPDCVIIDSTGCSHLWDGEAIYLNEIIKRLDQSGYKTKAGIASTIGTAWALAHYGDNKIIVENGNELQALIDLPPEALRINNEVAERLHKLGLNKISQFIKMPRPVLRRRFGNDFIHRIDQALGIAEEWIQPVEIISPYSERLTCLEPIVTLTGIEIALYNLLDKICSRLQKEQLGVRNAIFKIYRIDGHTQQIEIGTNRATADANHLFKLFELKLETLEPGLGIELFMLEATKTASTNSTQENIWNSHNGLADTNVLQLLDRIENKIGPGKIFRYLPAPHHWPERSFKAAKSLEETSVLEWDKSKRRPLILLPNPAPISVTAPIPDYPPMLFRYQNKIHKILKADGPERIEQEWWIQDGLHRDYYYVEDEEGNRYWLFRLGHYDEQKTPGWFLHGYGA